MSVSAKNVHESLRIGNSAVSVTSSRFLTIDKAKLGAFSIARSGHTAVVWGQKMYIFGGILELTKELNDMVVFDF